MSVTPFYPSEETLRRMYDNMCHEFKRYVVPYWKDLTGAHDCAFGGTMGELENTKDHFKVAVDVRTFHPKEVEIYLTGNEITISGHHEERQEGHARISRSFVRKYTLPDDVNLDAVRSHLSNEGKLTIEAPKKVVHAPGAHTREIPIEHDK